MFCTQCGNQQNNDAAFCSNCGYNLKATITATDTANANNETDAINVTDITDTTNTHNTALNDMKPGINMDEIVIASMGKRVLALLLDGFIVLTVTSIFQLIPVIGQMILIAVNCAYVTYFNSSKYMSTFGKRILGLAVVGEDGSRLSIAKAFFRWFIGLWMITELIAFFTPNKQGLHDFAVGSVVVQLPAKKLGLK